MNADPRLVLAALALAGAGCRTAAATDAWLPAGTAALTEVAASERQWTGLAISQDGRIFVNFPLWSAAQPFAVGELAADGSVFLEVPADTPLRLRTLDEQGRAVIDSGGWVWVRPAEKRGCIGCHEDRERAPANRFPEVLTGDDPRPIVVGPREVAER